jgi:hypothetical protein
MSTLPYAPREAEGFVWSRFLTELEARQPRLAAASVLFLLAIGPIGLPYVFDDRLVNGIDIWMKPMKFLGSLAIYYATLAWFHGYLPLETRRSRLGRAIVTVPVAVGLLEMTWLIVTASLGQPSHFNRSAPVFEISYALAGVGATTLMVVALTTGILIGRRRQVPLEPAFRLAIVLGCGLAFVATMATAGYLASGAGHWVGGVATDAGGLPIVGWSRTGGDLRVAHFLAMHALQIVPLAGWLVTRSGIRRATLAVWSFAAA